MEEMMMIEDPFIGSWYLGFRFHSKNQISLENRWRYSIIEVRKRIQWENIGELRFRKDVRDFGEILLFAHAKWKSKRGLGLSDLRFSGVINRILGLNPNRHITRHSQIIGSIRLLTRIRIRPEPVLSERVRFGFSGTGLLPRPRKYIKLTEQKGNYIERNEVICTYI